MEKLYEAVSILKSFNYEDRQSKDMVIYWYVQDRKYEYTPDKEMYELTYENAKEYFTEEEANVFRKWLKENRGDDIILREILPTDLYEVSILYCHDEKLKFGDQSNYDLPFEVVGIMDKRLSIIEVKEEEFDRFIKGRKIRISELESEIEKLLTEISKLETMRKEYPFMSFEKINEELSQTSDCVFY